MVSISDEWLLALLYSRILIPKLRLHFFGETLVLRPIWFGALLFWRLCPLRGEEFGGKMKFEKLRALFVRKPVMDVYRQMDRSCLASFSHEHTSVPQSHIQGCMSVCPQWRANGIEQPRINTLSLVTLPSSDQHFCVHMGNSGYPFPLLAISNQSKPVC